MCDPSNIRILYFLLSNGLLRIHIKFGYATIVGGDKDKLVRLIRMEDSVDAKRIFQA